MTEVKNYRNNENIFRLAKEMNKQYEIMYINWKSIINSLINNKVTDSVTIEKCLDRTMDILTNKGYDLFMKLCKYYATINQKAAQEYLDIYNELYGEEKTDVKKRSYKQ